ncbi:hypothetical protein TU51_05130 [Bacillus cytotoxicus]|uniref:DUF2777 domain-containing protein n=1 Tax=Bacillus cytotoxicus TaxID=580165 RepID=UPI000660A5F7|nr:DUF2777 domain-containing protein [Bacillus cytotoxicus]AWC31898.1 DUF2777 domain-containing protein [Bacillus cytotoxicus]AWC35934.1 DUF2777 domain-containing protein [Bacillus cytotoxicus]AWC60175.1 DUF2777 domain-containing protein [Bacillus cytotoxicus]KMT50394.1 hypothetical protein TU51_05130 [Bacillus cytotoxicus]HDR7308266.1 DUF2777 domain-containing protein [Bacillus cytotoxicus]
MKQRKHILYNQARAHTIGNVEYINDEWIFFDDENDEAFLLEDIIEDGFEVLYNNNWLPARFYEKNILQIADEHHPLQNGEMIRIRKKLLFSYNEWIEELSDSAFSLFIDTLQTIHYSLYDCIYCHNFLSLQPKEQPCEGVNILLFDNEDMICALHHHYVRYSSCAKDIFQFTKANGEVLHIDAQ